MKVIITIPAYNEENTIGNTIEEIKEIMSKEKYDYIIHVLDDGSIDNTFEISKSKGVVVNKNKRNLGLAETFKNEMKYCLELGADIIVHTDADGQFPAKYIPKLIKKVEEGDDLVLGARFGKGNYSGSTMKKLGNIAFAKLFSNLLRMKINDTTSGFRAFTKDVAKLPLINNFTYTQEQLLRAGKANMSISDIPITTNKTRKSKLFKNSFDYAIKAWINILRIYRDFEPLKFFGRIGFLFFCAGFLIGLWLVYLFLTTGKVGHYPSIILGALLMITGVQIVLFGFFADMKRK